MKDDEVHMRYRSKGLGDWKKEPTGRNVCQTSNQHYSIIQTVSRQAKSQKIIK